jgi:hypothetical protein
LANDETVIRNGLWDVDTGTLLQFYVPLAPFPCPDVAFVTMFLFEFLGVCICDLKRLQIMDKLDLRIEDLVFWVVTTE